VASRKAEKERLRQERLERERELAAATRRRRLIQIYGTGGLAVVAIVVVALVVALSGSSGASHNGGSSHPVTSTKSTAGLNLHPAPYPGALGPEQVPVPNAPQLASNASSATGSVVDGIQCNAGEKLIYHVHTHLTVFVNGIARQIPYGLGISPPRHVTYTTQGPYVDAGTCFYWLHTHAADGIIHIESPLRRVYTLGNFFDIWGQPLSSNQVGPAKGKVTALYNGKLYTGNPRNIPLGSHTEIELDVGTPLIKQVGISWAATGL
jgi:hypothetical protein